MARCRHVKQFEYVPVQNINETTKTIYAAPRLTIAMDLMYICSNENNEDDMLPPRWDMDKKSGTFPLFLSGSTVRGGACLPAVLGVGCGFDVCSKTGQN